MQRGKPRNSASIPAPLHHPGCCRCLRHQRRRSRHAQSFFATGNNIFLFIILIFIICLIGLGASTAYLIPWSLLPDAIDDDPEKSAGIYTAWMVLIQKIGIGISVQLLGILLSLSGYKIVDKCISFNCFEQPQLTQITIRLCISLIPSILIISGLFIMREWDKKTITN